ncbi:hypothetical protein [Stenotrophomonas sp.]|uniref:hypothetical protein n=1 Tax=Stenotrophomonas sp. TaxID=69392 RepID=UPI0028AF8DB3|nr:hypothetical protein [Stenotrophomonas sp.]
MIRRPVFNPRTVAREIPGLFEAVLPQLTPGVVSAFNRGSQHSTCQPVPEADVAACKLQHAMLFELAFAVGEMLIEDGEVDWTICLEIAIGRQRRHFDAKIPSDVPEHDKGVALHVGENLASMLRELAQSSPDQIVSSPSVPGFQWIASGNGDFSIGPRLIEVKCAGRNFTAPDYRQLTMYWLLSYARAIETDGPEWQEGILLNPRTAKYVNFRFDDLLRIVGAGRTKADILALFASLISTRGGT